MSAWQVLFDWPTGAVWGNWIDDIVCLFVGFIVGAIGVRAVAAKLHAKLDDHHRERREQHAELMRHLRGGRDV